MGVTGGVKELVAEALKIVDESGLPYELGAMQTTVEGNPDEVMAIILRCHRTAGGQSTGRRGDSGQAAAPAVKSRRKMKRR
jgi:uncharacterized protein YqgV (UPF0045/DUF77 family)